MLKTLIATGTKTKEYPSDVIECPAITGVKLVAAAGGCRQRQSNITIMDAPTAIAAAVEVSEIFNAQVTPTTEDNICPPANGQGCAKGLFGIKNKITADAPIEATIIGNPSHGETILVSKAIKKIEQKQANKASNFALNPKLTGSRVMYFKNRKYLIGNDALFKHNKALLLH